MKKHTLWLIVLLLVLVSCSPKSEEEIVQPNDEQNDDNISIVPSYQLSDEEYQMVLPFKPSQARGVIVKQMGNRLDINEVEKGLRRHSTSTFDPDTYYFEEGQYMTKEMVINLITELNPEINEGQSEEEYRDNPRYLSHIIEQNYLEKDSDDKVELAGVSIAIALKSIYQFNAEDKGPYFEEIDDKEIQAQGKDIAQSILEQLRKMEDLNDIPIMFLLYREVESSSPVPGNFFAKTVVEESDMLIKEWEEVNEAYVLFPSSEGKNDYPDENDLLKEFGEEINTYFPNYVGYIGEGFYENGKLNNMTIEIPIEFTGESEVIGFTQYVYGLVKKMIPNDYDIEVSVKSEGRVESFIQRGKGSEEPYIHIFD